MPFLFNAAKKLGSTNNEVLLFNGSKDANYKSEIGTFASPSKVHILPSTKNFTIDEACNTTATLISKNFTHVLATHTLFFRDLIPRIAGKLDLQPITDITAITVL